MLPRITSDENCATSLRFELTNPNGSAMNLAGCSAKFDLRRGTPDQPGSIVLAIRTTGVSPILGIASNIISGTLTATHLSRTNVPAGDYWAELIVTLADGNLDKVGTWIWQHFPTGEGLS